MGKLYVENQIDYEHLGNWCKELANDGNQLIVCENMGADWLPFQPLVELHGQKKRSIEAIWTNY